MTGTDTNPKPHPSAAEKILAAEIRQLLKDTSTAIEDRQREIKILQRSRDRLLELLHRITIADEPTPTVGTGSQTGMSAIRASAERIRSELEKGKP
jgi:hypothetical protein